jgi:hypothetical protein
MPLSWEMPALVKAKALAASRNCFSAPSGIVSTVTSNMVPLLRQGK